MLRNQGYTKMQLYFDLIQSNKNVRNYRGKKIQINLCLIYFCEGSFIFTCLLIPLATRYFLFLLIMPDLSNFQAVIFGRQISCSTSFPVTSFLSSSYPSHFPQKKTHQNTTCFRVIGVQITVSSLCQLLPFAFVGQ